MKKLAIGLLTVLAGIVAVSAAAIIPEQQAFAQQRNTVTATQSNSASVGVSQTINQAGSATGGGSVSQTAHQGFCLQINQQNAAAGNNALNQAFNTIGASNGGFVNCS